MSPGAHSKTRQVAVEHDETLVMCPYFEKYYRHNLGQHAFDALWAASHDPLPCVIRTRDPTAKLEGGAWTPISWHPGAFEMDADAYRENTSARRSAETLNRRGQAQFGEAASLVPVKLLEVQKGQLCADLCAAPGNKTIGLCDATGSDGMVLANDFCAERCCLALTRQAQKGHCCGLIVTLSDATQLPETLNNTFDRVLCDAPCSADGTLRKHRNAVLKFNKKLQYACELHDTQVRLLVKAFNMCKPGGRVVYSTCSFNPVENEAVVQACLKYDVKLLDAHAMLPDTLPAARGLISWALPEDDAFDGFSSTPGRFHAELYPQNCPELTRCARLTPDLANVGGFFVAVFQKNSDAVVPLPELPSAGFMRRQREMLKWRKDVDKMWCPFRIVPFPIEQWPGDVFGIAPEVVDPETGIIPGDCIFMQTMRNETKKTDVGAKKVMLVSRASRDVVAQLGPLGGLVIMCGRPLLKRLRPAFLPNAVVRWRLSQESSALWDLAVSKRHLEFSKNAFESLLHQTDMPIADVFDLVKNGHITGLETCNDSAGAVLIRSKDVCPVFKKRRVLCALLMASKLCLQLDQEELQSVRDSLLS